MNRAGVLSLVAAAAAAVAVLAGAGSAAPRRFAGISFDDRAGGRLVITARAYRLTLSRQNGKILDLVDRTSGTRVIRRTNGCLWGAATQAASYGGCSLGLG